jgi:hypothetical protein
MVDTNNDERDKLVISILDHNKHYSISDFKTLQ